MVVPGPGLEPPADGDSWVTTALTGPHRLLEPLRAADAAVVSEDLLVVRGGGAG